jgi:TonB family protein
MKPFLVASLASFVALGSACATTSGNGLSGRDGPSPGTKPALEVDVDGGPQLAPPTFPARASRAELRAADRFAARIRNEHGGTVAARVELCVAPSGDVASVDVSAPSTMPEYDRAVVDAIATWRYEGYAAPAATRVCQQLTVAYRAP